MILPPLPALVRATQDLTPPTWAFPGGKGAALRLSGRAMRQRYGVDFYEIALYVDGAALKRRTEGGPTDPARLSAALASGEVPLALCNHFLYEAGGHANLRFTHEALRRYWPEGAFDPDAPELKAFNAFFGRTIVKGETHEVFLDGKGSLFFRKVGEPFQKVHFPRLARAFARMYFAEAPLDGALRDKLLGGAAEGSER